MTPMPDLSAGSCSGLGDLMFPHPNETWETRHIVKLCAGCPVADPCRDYALHPDVDVHGVWGGLTEQERRRLKGRATRHHPTPRQERKAEALRLLAAGRDVDDVSRAVGVNRDTLWRWRKEMRNA